MKKPLPNYFIRITLILCCVFCYGKSSAQEYFDGANTIRQWYYNNLESATAGSPATFFPSCGTTRSTPVAIDIATNTAFGTGSKIFTTPSSTSVGYIKWDFLGTSSTVGANVSMATANWEWEFDYKNTTGVAPVDPNQMTGGTTSNPKDAWRYWLIANAYNSLNNTFGLYVALNGTSLVFRSQFSSNSNGYQEAATGLNIPANTDTYQIRIEKNAQYGYYLVYVLDRTTGVTIKSNAINVGTSQSGVDLNTYNFSYLEATAVTANHFQWDNFNFYQAKLEYIAINGSANGISTNIYPGIVDAIPYAVNVNVRGDISIGRFVVNFSGNASTGNQGQSLYTSASLYKTSSTVMAKASGIKLGDFSGVNTTNTGQLDLSGIPEYYYSPGTTTGATVNVINYFFLAQGRNPFYSGFPTTVTYSVSTTTDDNFHTFYQNFPPFNASSASSASTPSNNGDIWDWTGLTSANWTTSNAWTRDLSATTATPSTSSDIVRIGVVAYTSGSTQPAIPASTNINIGSLTLGTNNTPNLTINSGSGLTMNTGLIVNASATAVIQGQGGIILPTGSVSTMASGSNLTVSTLTSSLSGTFTNTAGTLTLSGTQATNTGTLSVGSSGIINMAGQFQNQGGTLTIGAPGSIGTLNVNSGGVLQTTSTVTVGPTSFINLTGSGTVQNSSSTFTLLSDGTGSATIGPILGTGSISGNVNVQRYMSGGTGKHGYRLLSSPVTTTTMGTSPAVNAYTLVSLQKTTPITGWGVTTTYKLAPTANAFDGSPTGNPSVLFYYEPNKDPSGPSLSVSDYKGLSSINDALPVGNGFLFYFRGDRTVTATKFTTSGAPENTTLNNTGTLNQGNISVYIPTAPLINYPANTAIKEYAQSAAATSLSTTLSYTTSAPTSTKDGFHLIGNPYAATIDMDKVKAANLYTNVSGDYIVIMDNNGAFSGYQMGTGGSGRLIASGQGFFVRGVSSAPASPTTFKFTEACKATAGTAAPTGSFDVAANEIAPTIQGLHIKMSLDTNNTNETLIQFGYNKAHNGYGDHEDLPYSYGPNQTTYLASYTSDNRPCLINQMSTLDSVKKVVLYVQGPSNGRYTFDFSGAQTLDARYKVYLRDSLMNDTLDLAANNKYQFNIDNSNPATYGLQRFSLVVVPSHIEDHYQLTSFAAVKNSNSVELNWKTAYEGNYTGFKLQRSIDGGKTFVTLGAMQSDGSGNYGFTDTNPVINGANQYRVLQTIDNADKLSSVVTVSYLTINAQTAKLQVYPNPVASNIQVAINPDDVSGSLAIKIYSMRGDLVMSNTFSKNSSVSMDVSKLIQGSYVIKVNDSKTSLGSATFTKQ